MFGVCSQRCICNKTFGCCRCSNLSVSESDLPQDLLKAFQIQPKSNEEKPAYVVYGMLPVFYCTEFIAFYMSKMMAVDQNRMIRHLISKVGWFVDDRRK